MFKPAFVLIASLTLLLSSTDTTAVFAQDQDYSNAPNATPAVLQSVRALDTPEKQMKVIREKYNISLNQQWPSNFAVPVYNSNVLTKTFSHSTKGSPSAAASLTTKDSPKQVFDFYKSACERAGWKVKVPSAKSLSEMGATGDFFFLTADRNKESIFLTCQKDRQTSGTIASVTWNKNP